MFCVLIMLLQYFKNVKAGERVCPPSHFTGGAKQPPCLRFLKYCNNVINAQNMLMYFRLHCLLYIFNRGVAASQADLLKNAL